MAEAILDNQVFHNGQGWVTPILRRDLTENFPTKYEMAKKRSLMFECRLDRTERIGTDLKRLSFARMEKMLENGHFRKLSAVEALYRPANTCFLPMLAVTNPTNLGKVDWSWMLLLKVKESV